MANIERLIILILLWSLFFHGTIFILIVFFVFSIIYLLYDLVRAFRIKPNKKLDEILTNENCKSDEYYSPKLELYSDEHGYQNRTIEVCGKIKTGNITIWQENLYNSLLSRGIECEIEYWDGYKHVDISIPWARLHIEVNGSHHYINPGQRQRDAWREYYSRLDGFVTYNVSNKRIKYFLDSVVDEIICIADTRYRKIMNDDCGTFGNSYSF